MNADMSVQKSVTASPIEQREFVLKEQPESEVPVVSSWGNSARVGANKLKEIVSMSKEWHVKALVLTPFFAVALGSTRSPTFALECTGYGLVLSAIIAASEMTAAGVAKGITSLTTSSEKTNPAKLREDIFAVAKEQGIIPNKFIDVLTLDTIEDPVAFLDDPSGTIFDRESANSLIERKMNHPVVPSIALKIENLVSLPEVKKQIAELKKAEQLKNKI